jgi:hypothetical protein
MNDTRRAGFMMMNISKEMRFDRIKHARCARHKLCRHCQRRGGSQGFAARLGKNFDRPDSWGSETPASAFFPGLRARSVRSSLRAAKMSLRRAANSLPRETGNLPQTIIFSPKNQRLLQCC